MLVCVFSFSRERQSPDWRIGLNFRKAYQWSCVPRYSNRLLSFIHFMCGKTFAEIILVIASNKSHPAEVDSESIVPDSSL